MSWEERMALNQEIGVVAVGGVVGGHLRTFCFWGSNSDFPASLKGHMRRTFGRHNTNFQHIYFKSMKTFNENLKKV